LYNVIYILISRRYIIGFLQSKIYSELGIFIQEENNTSLSY